MSAAQGLSASGGSLHLVAWAPLLQKHTMREVTIRESDLTVVATNDLGLLPASTDSVQTLGLSDGSGYALVVQGDAGQDIIAHLWSLSSQGKAQSLPTPKANVGLNMSADASGVYLYGGPAAEAVKPGQTRRVHALCVTSSGGSLIQAMVGSFGGSGRRVNRCGFAA